jgi:hypothetical protein
MTAGNRLLGLLVTSALLLLGAPWLMGELGRLGLESPERPDPALVLAQEDERGARLDSQRGLALRRMRTLDRIVQDLIDGRLTLAEAARQLRTAQDGNPGFWVVAHAQEKAATEDEVLYRHLVWLVSDSLENEPERARVVRQRLEVQWAALMAKAG